MRELLMVMAGLALAAAVLGAEPAPPRFVKKPVVTKGGDKVKIEFAVDRETDVTVAIENLWSQP